MYLLRSQTPEEFDRRMGSLQEIFLISGEEAFLPMLRRVRLLQEVTQRVFFPSTVLVEWMFSFHTTNRARILFGVLLGVPPQVLLGQTFGLP